jgi:hypothetical protein
MFSVAYPDSNLRGFFITQYKKNQLEWGVVNGQEI